jgi:AcrR family transcriptional regulator
MNDTKDKILDTAERLIGEQGYASTSLRHIIAEAGVNLAAVHYHFGSKEELLDELVDRKVSKVNAARIARLEALERAAGGKRLEVLPILEAFFEPTADAASEHPRFVLLMGRMYAEGMLPRIAEKHFHATALRFIQALGRALPELPPEELLYRAHFMKGAMAHAMCSAPSLPVPGVRETDLRRRLKLLVTFLAAGFRAPATQSAIQPVKKGEDS